MHGVPKGKTGMKLIRLQEVFAVCRLASAETVDLARPFTFLSVTDEEISLVCPADSVPANATHTEGVWRAFKIGGALDFGLVGVVASISGILATARISVFVISTYNTDYILVKAEAFDEAAKLLAENGYEVV